MTIEEQRALGKRVAEYLDREAAACNLDGPGMLALLLTVAYGWAERAGLDPKKNPRPLFEFAARLWDARNQERRIQTVEQIPYYFAKP